MSRRRIIVLASAALAAVLILLAVVLVRERVRRQRVFRPAAGETKPEPPAGVPPVAQWTQAFQQLEADDLDDLLDAIEQKHPALYEQWSLAYLHARALIDEGEEGDAIRKLQPFLAKDHPLRDLALYHRAALADGEEASRFRTALLSEHPRSMYREEVIEEEIDYLASLDDPKRLIDLTAKLAPAAPTELRRLMSARVVEALATRNPGAALTRGLALLRGGNSDDASDRVARALDRPALLKQMTLEQRVLLGDTFQNHRHYERAIAILGDALRAVYSDDLQFAVGRSYFGGEKYAEAEAAYLRGAKATKTPQQQATFYWHAARAAQLRGDDATAERLMTSAIAVKGKHPSTTPALTQRMRTRLEQRRFAEAASDLALLRKMAPNERAVLEGSLAYAVGMLAAGNTNAAVSALDSVPPRLLDDHDDAEFAYWRGRAVEKRDPSAAVRMYLQVLRAPVQTHFAQFARGRLSAMNVDRELAVRDAQVRNLVAAKKFDLAKRIQTDRVLLSTKDREAALQQLARIYRELPAYRAVLELAPAALPRFPLRNPDRDTLLMAMGLHGEAAAAIEKRWDLRPARAALTRSFALHQGGASRESIYAVEVMMKSVPRDFHPDLLPDVVSRLLYPRYFFPFIAADARRYDADPALVLSIMREESRFNPRAK
ncbi:MAG TPA: hypothetical protein VHL59_07610, partial [Thermoanaerobaculia bacterium]|nr:hypothetical protein [Thermoanaerobaculia bacterium]